ncbi:MAG: phosphoribosylanthranilate isomerase [Acidobacteriota bacterium]|jgi:phosphoribosylanthranilate isomerase
MLHIKVKVCGITNLDDAAAALEMGAFMLGFNFWPGSPRYIDPRDAARIRSKLPTSARCAGIFVDSSPGDIMRAADLAGIQVAQLHGRESPEVCASVRLPVIKAFNSRTLPSEAGLAEFPDCLLLIDAWHPSMKGGTGRKADWRTARRIASKRPVILAGGLGPGNVLEAYQAVRPAVLDVNSGVEKTPGVKDHTLLRALFRRLAPVGEHHG